MKGFKGFSSILEDYNTSFDQEKTLVGIDIGKGISQYLWPGLPAWF